MRAPRCIFLLFLFCFGCLEPYSPAINETDAHAIVIDGYIDAGGNAIVKLTRSLPLYRFADFPAETGATVNIESSSGENFHLSETSDGVYSASSLPVSQTSTYKLHIKASNSHEYVSDDVQIYPTPGIGRIYFGTSATGEEIEVKIDANDVNPNTSGFYGWESVETYEYRSPYFSRYKRVNNRPVLRGKGEFVDTCWRDLDIPIVTTTTKNLDINFISGKVISKIPKMSPKISMRYSILVRMRAMSEQEYNYRDELAKGGIGQGSIFAVIPGPIANNLHSLTSSSEVVLGYFRAQQVRQERFFIDATELPLDFQGDLPLEFGCDLETSCPVGAPVGGPNQCVDIDQLSDTKIIISSFEYQNFVVFTFTPNGCGDCRVKGGTTTPPYYW